MTNEELDFLFDLLRNKRLGFEDLLKPKKHRFLNWSADTRKQWRKDLKLVKSLEEKLLFIPTVD